MQVDNKLLDDLARVAAGAAGAVTGLRDEVEAQMRQRMERLLAHMDVVTREEFEVVRELAANARREQEALVGTVAALQSRIAALEGKSPAKVQDTAQEATQKSAPKTTASSATAKRRSAPKARKPAIKVAADKKDDKPN